MKSRSRSVGFDSRLHLSEEYVVGLWLCFLVFLFDPMQCDIFIYRQLAPGQNLAQLCPTRGPWAACGPRRRFCAAQFRFSM